VNLNTPHSSTHFPQGSSMAGDRARSGTGVSTSEPYGPSTRPGAGTRELYGPSTGHGASAYSLSCAVANGPHPLIHPCEEASGMEGIQMAQRDLVAREVAKEVSYNIVVLVKV
jgi:hypothetical protein